MTIRLLIADDHDLVREGLRATFTHTEIDIVGEATKCQEAIQLASAVDADVLLLDISMPGGDGFEVLRHVRATTSLAVVMYSMHDREHYYRRARELGVSGYLTKRASKEQLVKAIEAANRGESCWNQDICGKEMVTMASDEQVRLNSIVETAVDGIVTIDERGTIETVNPAAENLFGYAAAELVGRNVSVLMPDPYQSEHDGYLARYLVTGEKHVIGIGREVTARRKDGTTFPMRLSVGEFWLGQRRMFTGVIHDLTEQKQAEERALRSERLAAMGQMIGVITHESRNALQITQANLEMLAMELSEQAEALHYVNRIQSSQGRLHCLFEELRTFAGPMVLDREFCKLDRIVDRALGQLFEAGIKKRIEVQHEPHGVDLRCAVDQLRMERVFCNLLDNSLAACPDPVAIRASWSDVSLDDHPAVELTLFDNGPGFSHEQRQRVFEPFFTTKPKGTGLGLAISKRIIESHGGRIAVGNSRQAGAEFIITLPRDSLAVA